MNALSTFPNAGHLTDAAVLDAPGADRGLSSGSNVLRIRQPEVAPAALETSDLPCHRTILAVDIEDSTSRTNPVKGRLRRVMYDLLETALQAGGIDHDCRDPFFDRGDGVLALVRPVDHAATALLLNPIIPTLNRLLVDHATHHPQQPLRLRAVVHAGDVHYDTQGCFGEALDVAFRLLDATTVKKALRTTTAAMILVISDRIYHSVVRHGYRGVSNTDFKPLARVTVAEQHHRGWVHLPEHT